MATRKSNSTDRIDGELDTGLALLVNGPHRSEPPSQLGELSAQSLKAIIENYVAYYASGTGHTARAKRYDLEHFLIFLAGSPKSVDAVRVRDWTLQTTQDFVDHRLALGESPATVARRLATIKHFGRTLAERIHGFINPAREVKGPVIQASRPQGLNSEEVRWLREAAAHSLSNNDTALTDKSEGPGTPFLALRNCFLLELLLATGLRADEVRLLTLSQVSDDFSWLRNVKTKGRKFRNVYLDSSIRELLQQYLEARGRELTERFPTYGGLPVSEQRKFPVIIGFYRASLIKISSFGLSPKTIWRIIAGFGTAAQALSPHDRPNLHPHKLRHTFAHGLLDTAKDIRLVAQALGHSDVRTTMRYTERTEDEIARAIESKLRMEPKA